MRIFKINIFRDQNAVVLISKFCNFRIFRMPFIENEIYMNGLMTKLLQMFREIVRNVNIAKKFHYATARRGCAEMESLANVSDAIMSSFSNSGCSTRISAKLIPEAKRSRITSTGHLMPLMHGLPWQISGSTVMRLSKVFGSIKEFWAKLQSSQAKKSLLWTSNVMICILTHRISIIQSIVYFCDKKGIE
jgi:hypothetical protein